MSLRVYAHFEGSNLRLPKSTMVTYEDAPKYSIHINGLSSYEDFPGFKREEVTQICYLFDPLGNKQREIPFYITSGEFPYQDVIFDPTEGMPLKIVTHREPFYPKYTIVLPRDIPEESGNVARSLFPKSKLKIAVIKVS